ncbi:unnamed protein product [Colias eurytheme]|nr:unnamed protein product [Colias eurytheme]
MFIIKFQEEIARVRNRTHKISKRKQRDASTRYGNRGKHPRRQHQARAKASNIAVTLILVRRVYSAACIDRSAGRAPLGSVPAVAPEVPLGLAPSITAADHNL